MKLTDEALGHGCTVEKLLDKMLMNYVGVPRLLFELDVAKELDITPHEAKDLLQSFFKQFKDYTKTKDGYQRR